MKFNRQLFKEAFVAGYKKAKKLNETKIKDIKVSYINDFKFADLIIKAIIKANYDIDKARKSFGNKRFYYIGTQSTFKLVNEMSREHEDVFEKICEKYGYSDMEEAIGHVWSLCDGLIVSTRVF